MKFVAILVISTALYACNSADTKVDAANGDTTTTTAVNPMEDSANYTAIQWIDSTFRDLGNIKAGQVVEVSWRLKNAGNKPLVIQNVLPGCGCTVAEKPEAPIMPGEEGVIKGKFDSNGQADGEHRKYITVLANTQDKTNHQLEFRVSITK